jgi:hypothetical protein
MDMQSVDSRLDESKLEKLADELNDVKEDEQLRQERSQLYRDLVGFIKANIIVPFFYGLSGALGMTTGYLLFDILSSFIKKKEPEQKIQQSL